ncbi:uncharacterized protein LOC116027054 [Ipomoea triloba]|uniref:uncharacterized protein LOC116027054 n=1 Tax=Ipomoea triloba TaxID=35885 RepID=UPI00125D5BE0|nr:uncharacterized protein LOC116027054 [Ipomoea triloba]
MGEAQSDNGKTSPESSGIEKPTEPFSFKQVLANETTLSEQQMAEEIDLVSEDEEDGDDDIDKNCPIIRLTREEKVRLRSKWKQTLIVKVMGRNVGYVYLLKRLTALWRPKARMELVTIDNGYYLAKFASVEDYEFAKYGGPWMVLDHYLIVKEWVPNFDPFTEKTESMIVWIRFPCLPAEYFDHKFLMRVGSKIGRPINIDTATSLVSRASFARVCVEVDITKPLLAKFTLKNRVRPIVYEGLHLICFKCGMYGHNADGCRLNHDEENTQEENSEGGHRSEINAGAGNGHITGGNGRNNAHKEASIIRPEILEDYGSWMIAMKPKRNYNRNQGNNNQIGKDSGKKGQQGSGKGNNSSAQSGSRFASLANAEGEKEVEVLGNDQNMANNRGQGTRKTSPTKGKRPTTQVSEKQIEGNNLHGQHRRPYEVGESSARRNTNQRTSVPRNNQAGAASEHTLVMGDKEGPKTTQVFEAENYFNAEEMGGSKSLSEHHSDPSDGEQSNALGGQNGKGEAAVASGAEAMELEA